MTEQFWAKVDKTDGCWLWTGPVSSGGYGVFWIGKKAVAHRWIWEATHGPIPSGLYVCHHCDTPRCVRPDHLFLGTNSENQLDASRKGRNGMQRHPERNPLRHMKGSRHWAAALTETQATDILRRGQSGEQTRALAEEYGISVSQVQRIIGGQRWRHLARPEGT